MKDTFNFKENLNCVLCNESKEVLSHMLFSCKIAQHIWWKWYNLFGLSSILPNSAKKHFWRNFHGFQGDKSNLWWYVRWCSIVWKFDNRETV